jgi:hypothetical protein
MSQRAGRSRGRKNHFFSRSLRHELLESRSLMAGDILDTPTDPNIEMTSGFAWTDGTFVDEEVQLWKGDQVELDAGDIQSMDQLLIRWEDYPGVIEGDFADKGIDGDYDISEGDIQTMDEPLIRSKDYPGVIEGDFADKGIDGDYDISEGDIHTMDEPLIRWEDYPGVIEGDFADKGIDGDYDISEGDIQTMDEPLIRCEDYPRAIEDESGGQGSDPGTGLDSQLRNFNRMHNVASPADVDGDNSLTPLDALFLINQLNSRGVGPVASLSAASGALSGEAEGNAFLDTDNDGYISPLDVLFVINQLNLKMAQDSNTTQLNENKQETSGTKGAEAVDWVFSSSDDEDEMQGHWCILPILELN